MSDLTFNTPAGQTIDRELLVLLLNTGTSDVPVWSPVGSRVSESTMEYDWSKETVTDILGKVRTTLKKPIVTQSFDPLPLDAGDPAGVKLWNLSIREQNAAALANQDILVVHYYAGISKTAVFAERYDGSAVEVTGNGGSGGGTIGMSTTVTCGGKRTIGTVAVDTSGDVTFTAEDTDT